MFEGCLVDGGSKLESFVVCWEMSSLFQLVVDWGVVCLRLEAAGEMRWGKVG